MADIVYGKIRWRRKYSGGLYESTCGRFTIVDHPESKWRWVMVDSAVTSEYRRRLPCRSLSRAMWHANKSAKLD